MNCSEIKDELEYKLHKYNRAIEIHKLKTKSSLIESLVVGGAEMIENLAKLKLSKIVKKLFNVRKQNIDLMEIELKTEGSELSYISKVNENFEKN